MKKKIILSALILVLAVAGFFTWKFYGPAVHVSEEKYYLYIRTGSSFDDLKKELTGNKFLHGTGWFSMSSSLAGFKTIKPGRYKLTNGMSLFALVRMLKNGSQSPVNLVITKLRTKEALAAKLGNNFECDSAQVMNFLNNPDSLKQFSLDTNTIIAAVMPYTYSIRWNSAPGRIFGHFDAAYKNFWSNERKQKADSLHLKPEEVATLASIIDEETNAEADRPNIASVYLNRLSKGMPLQADPTLKFAMKNFGLKRILNIHKQVVSPYNTYMNKGLPPGPINTPQTETIDAVLNAPKTDYIFFVANSTLDGSSIFTTNITDHMKYARLYQQELDKRNVK
jgi:UPF0755 protein